MRLQTGRLWNGEPRRFRLLDPVEELRGEDTEIDPAWADIAAKTDDNAQVFSVGHRSNYGVLRFEGLAPIAVSLSPTTTKPNSATVDNDGPSAIKYSTRYGSSYSFFDAVLLARAMEVGMNENDVWRFLMFVNRMLVEPEKEN